MECRVFQICGSSPSLWLYHYQRPEGLLTAPGLAWSQDAIAMAFGSLSTTPLRQMPILVEMLYFMLYFIIAGILFEQYALTEKARP